ncbi:peptidyl-prolyl cis-trans isomerase FKBP19, chloroplastic-like [Musa acuminata AAA Group]|uniref:peptidylprolyl isomerase n=1 Tax=Musa acuminata subsp. malaccensis TaxID=214687 RepID=A0A804JK60_MUSAM|nr:PREDICTED: peptidyl-prolyl cis-trans isomerase FKBP19, chloroplastic [Musa acuminata subsp. malaccensis]XP_018682701.1 PREDICTED: peptidyl-prolyl cis-trans isomerase FKBP19, chloroplastic [Musa acuminata subsp. malaccensis]CAG1847342.1 unnamed protein product [Musa acuminata subsp. malaccensis]
MASISAAWILPNPWSSPIPRAPDRLTHHFKGCGKSRIGGGFIGEADGIPDAEVSSSLEANRSIVTKGTFERRKLLLVSSIGFTTGAFQNALDNGVAVAAEFADMPALRGKDYGKTKMRYPDYNETQSGLQYKDLRVGDGPTPKTGDTVVVDWDGYTIGYYGRIFEARNKTKGGSFEGDDKDFFKFKVGSRQVIPAFEEAIVGMAEGGIRRIIVPPDLGYPDSDFNKLGPRPTTFSGQRALDFVLRNQGLIDKTLLFDIELLKIVRN